MSYVQPIAPGFRYNLGTMIEQGKAGQCVCLAGNNIFKIQYAWQYRTFGILASDCKKDEVVGVWCMGGIYETDYYILGLQGGDVLSADSMFGCLTLQRRNNGFVVAETVSVVNGVLRFKLLV